MMGQWLPESGEPVGPGVPFELYVNNPQTTPRHELRTEIWVPLA